MRPLLASICLLLACTSAGFAQSAGTITGAVSDATNAVIPGASIAATNAETGARYETVSTETGNYALSQLSGGVYELSVELPGFKKYVRQGITVQVSQTLRIDVSLEVGASTEEVTVNADAPLLRTESSAVSHDVTSARLDDLPVLGVGGAAAGTNGIRNPMAVTQLLPGAYWLPNAQIRVNGAPNNSASIRIEGQDATNNQNLAAQAQVQPSVDAIQEVAIQTSNYAAEFGQAGGGVFNFTMKSGTNQYHGSVYDYFVNEALNAGTPFTQSSNGTLVRNRQRRNDYGFTIGGPVRLPRYDGRNKTFFFFSWEQYRDVQQVNSQALTVPTAAYRAGDFSQALTGRVLGTDPLGRQIIEGTIYDPATTRVVNGQVVRDPFPDNRIPLNRMDPVALKVQALIPQPTNSGLINNYINGFPNDKVTTIPAVKIDQNLGSRQKVSFYWSETITTSRYDSDRAAADGLPDVISTARSVYKYAPTLRVNYDLNLSPTVMLHLGGGWQRIGFDDHAPNVLDGRNFDPEKELGLKGTTANRQFPQFSGLTAARGGMKTMGPGSQSYHVTRKPTGNANLTWVKNNHTYKAGTEFQLERYQNETYTGAAGQFAFSGDQTGLPSTQGQNLQGGTVGFPYASFLLGLVSSGNIATYSTPQLGKTQIGLFVQDTWKVTRAFTLDYGLRYDYGTYVKEPQGRLPNFSPTEPNPSAGGQLGAVIYEGNGPGRCSCKFATNYPYAFGPRLGAAYQVSPKTVLRLGWGVMYYITTPESGTTDSASALTPFSSPTFGDPAMRLQVGVPITPVWPNYDRGLYPTPGTLTSPPIAMDRNAGRPARQMQWSVGLQREIFPNLAVEATYVGNRGVWWYSSVLDNINALTPQRIAFFGLDVNNATDRTLLTSRLDSPLAATRGFNRPPYAGFPTSSTVAQSLRPFPQFGNIPSMYAPLGNTWYDALQMKATKRFSHGLDFTTTFSWQKELALGAESGTGGGGVVNDVFNRQQNKYISSFSRPLTLVIAANYELPELSSNRVLSTALRDWQIGAVLQYASGQPIRVPTAQNNLNSVLFRSTFANRVTGEPLFTKDLNCHCIDPNKEFVLNPKAWVDPAAGQFGSSAAYYDDYRQQRRPQESMSLGRLFRITEGAQLQIRIEFSNVFNRTYMSNPDSTNAKATQSVDPSTSQVISGFGRIPTLGATGGGTLLPRSGTIVARIRF